MDSQTLLKKLGLNPQAILDALDPDEQALLQEQADYLCLTIPDLLAMCAAHSLTPANLVAAERARVNLLGDN